MEVELLIESLVRALLVATGISAVPLLTSMVVGLALSILQAATQIQEQTLSFTAKLVTVGAVLYLCSARMSTELLDYATVILSFPISESWP